MSQIVRAAPARSKIVRLIAARKSPVPELRPAEEEDTAGVGAALGSSGCGFTRSAPSSRCTTSDRVGTGFALDAREVTDTPDGSRFRRVSRLVRHYKASIRTGRVREMAGLSRALGWTFSGYPAPVSTVSRVYGIPCWWTAMLGWGRSVGGFAEKCPAPSSGRPLDGAAGAGHTPDEVNHGPRDSNRPSFARSGAYSMAADDVGSPGGRPAGLADPIRHVHDLTSGPIDSSPTSGLGEPRPCAERGAAAERRPA